MKLSGLDTAVAREAVVLLHSSGSSSRQWKGLMERLSPHYDVRARDQHGPRPPPAGPGGHPR